MSNLIVQTTQGAVRGMERGGVSVWRGIPYAAPPVGPLRLRPPRPPEPWTGERDATRFAPVAPQSRDARAAMMSGIGERVPMSEDCLALNVFSPAADGQRRPVMVWLHGGAFMMGSGSTPLYDATSFAARHDLVVVTINYRIGLLGFLYLGELAGGDFAEGNAALLDQIAALAWVRDNIAGFGGDPDAVTVMGQSAGAIAIATLLAMPAARGLFHRAVIQSGASGLSVPSRSDATAFAGSALAELAIDPGHLDQLADVPVDRLIAVQDRLIQRWGLGAFTPVVDGVTLLARPIDVVRAGDGARVPLLIGTNRDEWTLFDVFVGHGTTELVRTQLRARLGDATDGIHAAYQQARADGSAERAWVDLVGDVAFRVPVLRLAEAQAAAGAPVWMYRFDWTTPAFDGRLGATHALELPFVWNTMDKPFAQLLVGGDPRAVPLATAMHDTWAAFLRTGEPTGAGLPDWPAYRAPARSTMILDGVSRVEDDPDRARREAWPAWPA
ncbi:MAG TPA: carboxylesterase/lipase family protein [Kofleriaceae bacterium]|nr:carboxylesterase/lipase family protein [Kofleriaceae bacterium]